MCHPLLGKRLLELLRTVDNLEALAQVASPPLSLRSPPAPL